MSKYVKELRDKVDAASEAAGFLDQEISTEHISQEVLALYSDMVNTTKLLGDAIKNFKQMAVDNRAKLGKIVEDGDLMVAVDCTMKANTSWKSEAISQASQNARLRKQGFDEKAYVQSAQGASRPSYTVTVKTRGGKRG